MRIETTVTVRTFCHCGKEINGPDEWRLHRREHHLEYWYRNHPQIMEMLKGAGFKDEPDPWNKINRTT